jgi:sulfate adenylyltransferase large subunit
VNDHLLNLVVTGHVDHGKSTFVGRLLYETGSLPKGKIDEIRNYCAKNSKPFEYAFILDALKEERKQGITIDVSRVFFKSKKRRYLILDAPGHEEFLKNMVTGAARADAALLVIDAKEGIQINSQRHGVMLSMLGITKVIVVVNKMDVVDFSKEKFDAIRDEYGHFLKNLKIEPLHFIPISAYQGDGIVNRSENLKWYKGLTVLDALDALKISESLVSEPLRMQVQDVYRFSKNNDERRIVAGHLLHGQIQEGQLIRFVPSGKIAKIKKIENTDLGSAKELTAEAAVGFTLDRELYVRRGEMVVSEQDKDILVGQRIQVHLFWLGDKSLRSGDTVNLKINSQSLPARVQRIHKTMNSSSLVENIQAKEIKRMEVADCELVLSTAIAYDLAESGMKTHRFVLVQDYMICGGGIVTHALVGEQMLGSLFFHEEVDARGSGLIVMMDQEMIPLTKEIEGELRSQKKPTIVLNLTESHLGSEHLRPVLQALIRSAVTVVLVANETHVELLKEIEMEFVGLRVVYCHQTNKTVRNDHCDLILPAGESGAVEKILAEFKRSAISNR